MTVTFYKCTADKRLVDKTSKMTSIMPGTIIDADNNVDIIAPSFTVEYNANYVNPESISTINYLKINELNRFYFIRDMIEMPGTKLLIDALCDVRMSFINGHDFPVSVVRNEKIKNSRIVDKSLPIDPQYHEPEVLIYNTDLFYEPLFGSIRSYDIIETQSGTATPPT